MSECFTADRVDKNIARLTIKSFIGPGKLATELFELSAIHERTVQRLPSRHRGRKRLALLRPHAVEDIPGFGRTSVCGLPHMLRTAERSLPPFTVEAPPASRLEPEPSL